MRRIVCPSCGSHELHHYTDAYVLRNPVMQDDGSIGLLVYRTNEYDHQFFECLKCGKRPTESELCCSTGSASS